MQNSMMMFISPLSNQKYPFWANLDQKNQNCQFKLKFRTQTNSNTWNSMVKFTFSIFDLKYCFGPENRHCRFELKFGPQTILNTWNSMVVFIFSLFRPEISILDKFESKNQNSQFKLNFGIQTNLNSWNSMVMFMFSIFDWKYSFSANLDQKFKIHSLS